MMGGCVCGVVCVCVWVWVVCVVVGVCVLLCHRIVCELQRSRQIKGPVMITVGDSPPGQSQQSFTYQVRGPRYLRKHTACPSETHTHRQIHIHPTFIKKNRVILVPSFLI